MTGRKPKRTEPTHKALILPVLIAAAVFSTSRLLFWEEEIADWIGYLALHLLITAAVWCLLNIARLTPASRQDFEARGTRQKKHNFKMWLTMVALLLVTAMVSCMELIGDVHPMFR